MGGQCSQIYDQIIGNQNPRNRIKQFIQKNQQQHLNNLQQSQSMMLKSLQIQLHKKCINIQKCSKQFIKQGSKQIISYEKFSEQNYFIKFIDGSTYRGQIVNMMRQKQGQQKWKDGTRYIGTWKQNFPHGKGLLVSSYGFIFQGKWQYGLVQGQGKYYGLNGTYQGNWKRNQPHGFGVQTWKDGSMYEGFYQNGKKQGQGNYVWPDKSIYKGQWHNGKIQGKGKYLNQDGKVYQGIFLDNMMHGQGVYKWPDGRKYIGQYKRDKKQGYGRYYWPDGRYYQGQWLNGKRNGHGKITYPSGAISYGIWQDDKKIKQVETQNQFLKNRASSLITKADEKREQDYIYSKRKESMNQRYSKIVKRNDSLRKSTKKVPLYALSISPFNNLKNYYHEYVSTNKKNAAINKQKSLERYQFINSPLKRSRKTQKKTIHSNIKRINSNDKNKIIQNKKILKSAQSMKNRRSNSNISHQKSSQKSSHIQIIESQNQEGNMNKFDENYPPQINNTYKNLYSGKSRKSYLEIHLQQKIREFHQQRQ